MAFSSSFSITNFLAWILLAWTLGGGFEFIGGYFNPLTAGASCGCCSPVFVDLKEIEVIGNICENPTLLKQKTETYIKNNDLNKVGGKK